MEATGASDLHKTIEYLQNEGVNVKVYKYQPTKGNGNSSSLNKGKEKVGSLEKATQTDEIVNVAVYKYQPTKGKENASSSNKGIEKVDGKAIQIYTSTSKRKLAQRMRREREKLEGLSRYFPKTTGCPQPLIIAEGGIERNIANLQERTRNVLPRTPERVNIIHGEEPTNAKTESRGIKRNVNDLQEQNQDVLPQTPKEVNVIHGEEAIKGKENAMSLKKDEEEVGSSEIGIGKPIQTDAIKGKENATSSEKGIGKAMQTDTNTSKRKIAQRLRRERERLEALSHVSPVGVNSILGEKVKQNNPSRRALAQRMRRERERSERSEQPGATN